MMSLFKGDIMAYPRELRQRVIDKNEDGLTQTEIAEELSVSQSWVNKILRIYAQYGELFPPREKPGPKPKLGENERRLLAAWLAENHDLTLARLADRMTEETGKTVNSVNVFTALRAMGYSHKKNGGS